MKECNHTRTIEDGEENEKDPEDEQKNDEKKSNRVFRKDHTNRFIGFEFESECLRGENHASII